MAIFDDYISLKKASDISGYHSDYIGALIRSGKINGRKIGNRWTVSESGIKTHFSKKHYVPVSHAVFSGKNILFSAFLIVLVLSLSVYFVHGQTSILYQTKNTLSSSANSDVSSTSVNGVTIEQP